MVAMSIFADEPLDAPIHITIPRDPRDPRDPREALPGVVVHYVPELHSDDVTVIDGLRVTSVARTLVDLAEELDDEALRAVWASARGQGQLDIEAVRASRARVEWRPSLERVDRLLAEFAS